MPEYCPQAILPRHLDAFTRAYLKTAEWCDISEYAQEDCEACPCHRTDTPPDACGCACHVSDREAFDAAEYAEWTPEALAQAAADCAAFQRDNEADLDGADPYHTGHDFWLTRNGHGAGYWDTPEQYPNGAAKRLTDACRPYGEIYIYFDRERGMLAFG